MDRRTLLTGLAAFGTVVGTSARAAPPQRRRVSILLFDGREAWAWFEPQLRAELAKLGWIDGKNLTLQWNYANGDAEGLRSLAAQVVASAPDVILTRGTPATHILQEATRAIPIATGLGDPVGSGFARTYAEPGGNVTGISYAIVEASQKFVELLRFLVPGLEQLIVVWHARRAAFLTERMRPVDAAAAGAGIATRTATVADIGGFKEALRTGSARGPTAALIFGLGTEIAHEAVAGAALAARMPTMFEYRSYVDSGGLASFRYDWENQNQRAAVQIDKLLRGEKPGQIPFELPTRQEFVLNLKTARALGLTVPRSLLLRADAIVE